jgi:hypothetical protein
MLASENPMSKRTSLERFKKETGLLKTLLNFTTFLQNLKLCPKTYHGFVYGR